MKAMTTSRISAVMNMRLVEGEGDQPNPEPPDDPPRPGTWTRRNMRPAVFIVGTCPSVQLASPQALLLAHLGQFGLSVPDGGAQCTLLIAPRGRSRSSSKWSLS